MRLRAVQGREGHKDKGTRTRRVVGGRSFACVFISSPSATIIPPTTEVKSEILSANCNRFNIQSNPNVYYIYIY